MKVMVCHFVSDSHEVMTALIVVLPLIVVVEISLQLHRSLFIKTQHVVFFARFCLSYALQGVSEGRKVFWGMWFQA
jgi:hypothetical protein